MCLLRCASSRIGLKGAIAAPFLCVGALLLSPLAFPRIHGVTAQESGGISDEPSALEALEALEDPDAAEDAMLQLMAEAAAFRENPVDINSATVAELLRVPFMDPASANCIVGFRSQKGDLESLDELRLSGCLGESHLARLRPYLTVNGPPPNRDAVPPVEETSPATSGAAPSTALGPELRCVAHLRFTADEDFDDRWDKEGLGRFGSFSRLRLSYGDRLALSLACEKDPGERSFLDHTALTGTWTTADLTLGLGDVVGRWGQGLVLGRSGFPTTGGFPRSSDRLKGYDGAGESSARRGLFVVARRGRARVQVLAARTRLDAALDERGRVSTIRTTGYHRTSSESEGAGALTELLFGCRATAECASGVSLSASVLDARYTPPLDMSDHERRRFGFSGGEALVLGADILVRSNDLIAGLEAAGRPGGGRGFLAGLRLSRGNARVRAGAGFLSRDYWSPLGAGAPGFSGGTNGSVGWLAVDYRPEAGWRAGAEVRVTSRPWRSYHLELPGGSTTVRTQGSVEMGAMGRLTATTMMKHSDDEDRASGRSARRSLCRTRLALRGRGAHPIALSLTRAVRSLDGVEEGSTLTVATSVSGQIGSRLSWTSGLTSTEARGSAPVVVQYEPGLPGEFSLRSLNDSGVRWYIRLSAALRWGLCMTLRAGAGPGRERSEFGVAIEAGD